MSFWHIVLQQLLASSWLEITAVVFGLMSVWYSQQENILVYPTGMVSVLIYIYITFEYKLYADTGINGYYLIMSIYGWYHWTHAGDNATQIPISNNSYKENLTTIIIFMVSFLIIRYGLDFTDSDVPSWDALTTSTAITGMWLMARKKIENWIAWIITDLISFPLYLYKGLPFTALQFLIFTFLAVWGYFSWGGKLKQQNELRK